MTDTSLLSIHIRDELDSSSEDGRTNFCMPLDATKQTVLSVRDSEPSMNGEKHHPTSPEFHGFKTPSPAFRGFATPSPSEKVKRNLENDFSGSIRENIHIEAQEDQAVLKHLDNDVPSEHGFQPNIKDSRVSIRTFKATKSDFDFSDRLELPAEYENPDSFTAKSMGKDKILMNIKEEIPESQENLPSEETIKTVGGWKEKFYNSSLNGSNGDTEPMDCYETESEISFHSSTVHINIEIESDENQEENLADSEEEDAKESVTCARVDSSIEHKRAVIGFPTLNQSGLFVQPYTALPMLFGMKSGKTMTSIRKYIWDGGGAIENSDEIKDHTGHRLELWDPEWDSSNVDNDIFDYRYILDCIKHNKLLENLKEYRINPISAFIDSDPIKIVCGLKKWTDYSRNTFISDSSDPVLSDSEIPLELELSSESGSSDVYPTEDICLQTHFTYLASNIQNQASQIEKSPLHNSQEGSTGSPSLNNIANNNPLSLSLDCQNKDVESHESDRKISAIDEDISSNVSASLDRGSNNSNKDNSYYDNSKNGCFSTCNAEKTQLENCIVMKKEEFREENKEMQDNNNKEDSLNAVGIDELNRNTSKVNDKISYTSKKNKGKRISNHSKLNRRNKRVSNELRRLNSSNYFWCDELNSGDEHWKSKLRQKAGKPIDLNYSSNALTEPKNGITVFTTEVKKSPKKTEISHSISPIKPSKWENRSRFIEKPSHPLTKKSNNDRKNNSKEVDLKPEQINDEDDRTIDTEHDKTICKYNDNHSLQNKKYITNWVPRLKGKKLLIEGNLLDFDHEDPNHFKNRYVTSKVLARKNSNLVITKGGEYWLEGNLNVVEAMKNATPSFIIDSFARGVPEQWKTYTQQWRGEKKGMHQNNSYKTVVNYYINCIINQNNSS